MGNKTLADGTEIYESEFTGEQMDELLKLVKTEEELREFILSVEDGEKLTETEVNQLIADYARENNLGASDEVIRKVCQEYFAEHDITSGEDGHTPTTEEVKAAVEEYLREHPVGTGTVSDEQIASAVSAYLAENPIEGGMTTEQLNSAISEYLETNPITNVDEDVFEDMADEYMEDNTIWGSNLPVIFLDGDLTDISHDVAVEVKARFTSQFKEISEKATIKWQGSSSLGYPKKNFTLKFDSKHGFGWGKAKKWVLKANYIDHTHARNIVTNRIWEQVVKSRSDYETNETIIKLSNSPAHGTVDGFPIKLYLNGEYQGIYTLNIPKGDFQFKMDKTDYNQCILNGSGNSYMSNCFLRTTDTLEDLDTSEWVDELHDAPDANTLTKWNEVITFVKNSDNDTFKNGLSNYFDVQSLIDYYIFSYVSANIDGLAKNQIYYTYDLANSVWFASAYDLDSTWGLYVNGSYFVDSDIKCPDGYQSNVGHAGNKLYYKLALNFDTEIRERYEELREEVLSGSNILAEFEKFISRITTEQYEEDVVIYPDIPSANKNNISQIRTYVYKRLEYCDTMLKKPVVATGVSITETGTVNVGKTLQLKATIEPDNATNYALTWEVDNTGVATVDENGNVEGISEGTAIVTVTETVSNTSATSTITVQNVVLPKYSITNNLSEGVTADNETSEVEQGDSYESTITIPTGYTYSISVTMGGSDITSTAVNGKNISISAVTGDIVITVTTSERASGIIFYGSKAWSDANYPSRCVPDLELPENMNYFVVSTGYLAGTNVSEDAQNGTYCIVVASTKPLVEKINGAGQYPMYGYPLKTWDFDTDEMKIYVSNTTLSSQDNPSDWVEPTLSYVDDSGVSATHGIVQTSFYGSENKQVQINLPSIIGITNYDYTSRDGSTVLVAANYNQSDYE